MATASRPAANISHPDRFFIGGEWVMPSSEAKTQVIRPSDEEPFLSVPLAEAADVGHAVAAARDAFDNGPWPRMSPAERSVYLRKIAEALARRSSDIADIWTSQMGVLRSMSGTYADFIPWFYTQHADMADTFPFIETGLLPDMHGRGPTLMVHEPVGVVAAIIPWNGPILQISHKITAALLTGCTIVLKAAPEAPGEAYVVAEIMEEIDLPKGVLNVITAEREVSELLVRHPDVDKVSFTGSTAAGRKIASICGERIARVTLELGGKSAAVILEDADVGKLVKTMAMEACVGSGQVCASLTRLIVPRSRRNEIVDALASTYSQLNVGDPFEETSSLGPLAMKRQLDRVQSYIAKGVDEGARLVVGGRQPSHLNRGYYIEPTIFADVDNSMAIAREEIFGPVTSIISADSEEQAIAIANDTIYGLNASVFTEDVDRFYRVARRIRSGTVGHNADRADLRTGFGGFKQSGLGREGGEVGLRPYLEPKLIGVERMPSKL